MHGTFRAHIESGTVATVRFDARALPFPQRRWRSRATLLLAGCCLAALPQFTPPPKIAAVSPAPAFRPIRELPAATPVRPAAGREQPVALGVSAALVTERRAARSPAAVATVEHLPTGPLPPPVEPVDPVFVTLPEPTPAAAIPAIKGQPQPAPPLAVELPAAPAQQLAVTEEPAATADSAPLPAPARALRPVDIAQISESDVPSLREPQLHEPGLAVGGDPTLAAKIAAMQVTPLPPVRYPSSERAVMLAEAPTQMMVRIGGTEAGKVDFRMTADRGIDVKLADLLDLLAGHYDAAEFARLRQSAAADAYVSFDKLRAMGLNVRYDPVYDEVRIAG